MYIGYNTIGLLHHNLFQAITLLAEIGYQGVAIALNHNQLNPLEPDHGQQLIRVREQLSAAGMRSVVETSAPFLLDARTPHEPTLMSPDADQRNRRVTFLQRAVDVAAALQSDCVSYSTGSRGDETTDAEALERLAEGLDTVSTYAAEQGVSLAIEPTPGMFVDTLGRYERLLRWFRSPQLKLTLDLGNLYCQGEVPIGDYISRCQDEIINVHVSDRRAGRHDPLPFGEGEMDFTPILRALQNSGYAGGMFVELSKHSDSAPEMAQASYDFLKPMLTATQCQ